MTFIYLVAGLVVFWSVLLTVIFRLEKRMVWPYGELEPMPHCGDPSGYGVRRVAEAVAAGFTHFGWARDMKGPNYSVSYAMLISSDRDIFAIIGIGAVLKMPLAATWLYTPTVDGRTFYSTDHQTGVQVDISRNWTNQLVPAKTFVQLLQEHKAWIKMNGVIPRPFTPRRELAEFRLMRKEHFRAMQRTGLIDFTDGSESHFRFTLSGAAKTAMWAYFLGMARQLSHGRFPRSA